MMFDWAEYLRLAHSLAADQAAMGAEARLRTAVSRAYYAAFGRARLYLTEVLGVDDLPENYEIHEAVMGHYTDSEDARWRSIGSDLAALRLYRNEADYDAHKRKWHRTTELSLLHADDVVQELAGLDGAPW